MGVAQRRRRAPQPPGRVDSRSLRQHARLVPRSRTCHDDRRIGRSGGIGGDRADPWRRVHAKARRRRPLGARHDAVHDLVRGVVQDQSADPEHPAKLSRGHHRGVGAWPRRRRYRPDRILQRRILCRPVAVRPMARLPSLQGRADRRHPEKAVGVSGHQLQLHPAGRGRGRRGADGPQKLPRPEDFRHRPERARRQGTPGQEHHRGRSGDQSCHTRPRARTAESYAHRRPGQARPVRTQLRRRQPVDRGSRRRLGGHSGGPRRTDVRSRGAAPEAIPGESERDRQYSDRYPQRSPGTAARGRDHSSRQRCIVHLPAGQRPVHRRAVLGRGSRPCQRGGRSAGRGGTAGQVTAGIFHPLGRRVSAIHSIAQPDDVRRAAHRDPHLRHSVRAVQEL